MALKAKGLVDGARSPKEKEVLVAALRNTLKGHNVPFRYINKILKMAELLPEEKPAIDPNSTAGKLMQRLVGE